LSREDRRTQPEAFRKTTGIDYIENQCVKSKPQPNLIQQSRLDQTRQDLTRQD